MEVTELGMVTFFKRVQPENALLPIEVTVYCFPLYVTVEGMTTSPEYSPLLLYITPTSSSSSFV